MQTHLIRAIPEIAITERYRYEAEISETKHISRIDEYEGSASDEEQRVGTITALLPLGCRLDEQGMEFGITRKALLDLEKQKIKATEPTSLLCGWLLLRQHPLIEEDFPGEVAFKDLRLRNQLLPLEFGVNEFWRQRASEEVLAATNTYRVGQLTNCHIDVDVEIAAATAASAYSESQQIWIKITLRLPTMVSQVVLRYLELDWPLELFWALDLDSPIDYFYDVVHGKIGWLNRQLKATKNENVQNEIKYCWEGKLSIKETNRLALKATMKAKAQFLIDGVLLSGLDPVYFSSLGKPIVPSGIEKNGRRVQAQKRFPKTQSIIDIDIAQIEVPGVSSRREFYVVREIHFDGIIPTVHRLDDIEAALHDVGIHTKEPGPSDQHKIKQHIIRLGGVETEIKVEIETKKTQMTRVLQLVGGGSTTQTLDSGKIDIVISARHRDFSALTQLFSRFHALIEERFEKFQVTQ